MLNSLELNERVTALEGQVKDIGDKLDRISIAIRSLKRRQWENYIPLGLGLALLVYFIL